MSVVVSEEMRRLIVSLEETLKSTKALTIAKERRLPTSVAMQSKSLRRLKEIKKLTTAMAKSTFLERISQATPKLDLVLRPTR